MHYRGRIPCTLGVRDFQGLWEGSEAAAVSFLTVTPTTSEKFLVRTVASSGKTSLPDNFEDIQKEDALFL